MTASGLRPDGPARARSLYDPNALVAFGIAAAPPGLVGTEACDRLAAIPDGLPAAFEVGAFECHLGDDDGRLDFEACVRAAGGGRDQLAGPTLERLAATYPGWRRTIGFLQAWSDPASPLHDGIEAAWLEFDLDGAAEPNPFVIFSLRRDDDDLTAYSGPHAAALRGALDLLGDGVGSRVLGRIADIVEALAPTGALLHAGVRPLPQGPIVRLVVRLPRPHIPTYLERIGWPGSGGELARVLEGLCPATVLHSVNLDVGDGVGPRVGIEYHFRTSPETDARWRTVFDGLVAAGACTPARREQVSRWRPPDHPAHGLMREVLVKVVYEAGRPLAAKAYLPFTIGDWRG